MDTFDRDYRDDPRYKGHRDNISAFVEPRPVDPKKVCDVFNQTQLLHGPTARQYKLESPPLSVVDLLLLSISRWLKLLAAKMLQKTPNALSLPPVVDLLLLQCCCCSCAIARAPVDIRLRGERGQRGRLHVRSEACCLSSSARAARAPSRQIRCAPRDAPSSCTGLERCAVV